MIIMFYGANAAGRSGTQAKETGMTALAYTLITVAALVAAATIAIEIRRALMPGSAVRELLRIMLAED